MMQKWDKYCFNH